MQKCKWMVFLDHAPCMVYLEHTTHPIYQKYRECIKTAPVFLVSSGTGQRTVTKRA